MKKTIYLIVVILFVASFVLGFTEKPAAKTIVLKAVSFQAPDSPLMWGTKLFFNTINERAKGELRIDWLGGREVIGIREQFEAVRIGQIQIVSSVTGAYRGTLPEASVVSLRKDSPWDARKSGFYDIMVKLHKEQGVHFLGETMWNDPWHVWFKKRINTPAGFAGLKVRGGPGTWDRILKKLGATPVSLSFPDIYGAMERGVVDGFYWPTLGVVKYGWAEVMNYCLDPGVSGMDGVTLVNLDTWNSLPKHLQNLMTDVMKETERKIADHQAQAIRQEREQLKALKVEFFSFAPANEKYYVDITRQMLWENAKKTSRPDYLNKLKRLSD